MDYHPQHMKEDFNCNATIFIVPMLKDKEKILNQHVKQLSSIDFREDNPVYISGNLAHYLEDLNNLQQVLQEDNGSSFLWTTQRSH